MKLKLFFLSFALLLFGCQSSAPPQTFVLNNALALKTEELSSSNIAIRNISLPVYFDQNQIVYLANDSTLTFTQGNWVSDIQNNIKQIIQQDLSVLNNEYIATYPLPNNTIPKTIIDLKINELIANENHQFTISAIYLITDTHTQKIKQFSFSNQSTLQSLEPTAIVQATQENLKQLINQLNTTIQAYK